VLTGLAFDGIAFDGQGRLWVTTLLNKASWMDYPTQPAFGPTRHGRVTLYVTNGAFNSSGASDVVALQLPVKGVTP